MGRARPGALLVGVLLCLPSGLAAQGASPLQSRGAGMQDDPVSQVECCQTLLLPVGARRVALGSALGARRTPDAVFTNPAGLAGLEDRYIVLHTSELPGATDDVGAQMLAGTLLFTPRGIGSVGASYRIIDFGQQSCLDAVGNTTGSITLRHHVLLGSFATGILPGLRGGLSYKVYLERFGVSGRCEGASEFSARTQGLDLGVQYAPPLLPSLSMGAALTDLGFPLQTLNAPQSDPMPLRLRLASAYEIGHHFRADSTVAAWLSVEAALPPPRQGETVLSVGAELSLQELIHIRGGWASGQGLGTGAALGVGVHYGNFIVSVARTFQASPLAGDDPPLDLTFGVRF